MANLNYQPTTWNNNQDPPISADNLNHIEQGIKAVSDKADTLVTVEANPSSPATDRLTGLEVNGTTYEVGGGHKVYTDGGTLLPQQPNMVVKGVYSKNNSTDNITEIEVVREFQNDAEVQALTGEEAKGFQHTPDNVYRARAAADISFDPTNTLLTSTRMQEAMEELDAEHLPYSSTQSTKEKIDEIGTTIIEYTNNDVSNVTNFQVAESITLTKGTWILKGSLRLTTSGTRRIGAAIVEGTESAFSSGTYNAVLIQGTQNTANRLEVNAILKVYDDSKEYKLLCYSDDTYGFGSRIITAIKIA